MNKYYSEWLASQAGSLDSDVLRLIAFAGSIPKEWPRKTSDPSAFMRAITANAGDQQDALISSLIETMGEWKKSETRSLKEIAFTAMEKLLDNFGLVFLSGAALAIAYYIQLGIFDLSFITSIAAPEQARGLITFLFSFSTVAIFLIIVICIFFYSPSELKERIDHAKDILSLIIGIFGTILGFYFGSLSNTDRPPERQLYIANVHATPAIASPGTTVTITASPLGGTRPYTYDFSAVDPTGSAGLLKDDKDLTVDKAARELTLTIPIPGSISTPSSVTYTLTLKDANKSSTQISGVVIIVPKK